MLTLSTKQGSVLLKSDNYNLNWGDVSTYNKQPDQIFLASKKSSTSNWSKDSGMITNMGQFSQKGFEIEVNGVGSEGSLIYKIKHDELNAVLIDCFKDQQVADKITNCDILIAKTDGDSASEALSIGQNCNPKIMVFVSKSSETESLKQLLSQNLTVIENGYKIRSKDLNTDITQYLLLTY